MGKGSRQDFLSRSAYGKRPLSLIVEGIGDVVRLFYSPALKKLKEDLAKQNRDVFIIFVDVSGYWKNNYDLSRKMQGIIQSVRNWGAAYLDKSDPNDFKKYKALTADAVFIATPDVTHCEIAEEWLGPPRRCHQIFIEKPLDRDLNATRRLLGKLKAYDDSVLAFDHYRARMLPTKTSLNIILGFLENKLKNFTFYFLEDHSGSDTKYGDTLMKQGLTNRNGPVENERRVEAVREGLILDMMPLIFLPSWNFSDM